MHYNPNWRNAKMKRLFLILGLILTWLPVYPQEAENEEDDVDIFQMKVDSILALITPDTPDSSKAKYYNEIAFLSDNADTVSKYATLSLQYCSEDNYTLMGDNYSFLGWSNSKQLKTTEALNSNIKALHCFEKSKKMSSVASRILSIGQCFQELNQKDSVFYYYNKALDISIELKDTALIAYIYMQLGLANIRYGYHDTAIQYHQKALYLDSVTHKYLNMAFDYQNIGFALNDNHENEKALYYLKKSIGIYDTIPTLDYDKLNDLYTCYMSLASTYLSIARETNENKYADSCLTYINKIGNCFLKNGDDEAQFMIQLLYAKYLAFLGKYQEATNTMLETKKYLDASERNSNFIDYYNELSNIYEKNGDYKNALEAFNNMYEYYTKDYNDSTLQTVAKFQAEQETKIHRLENEKLMSEQRQLHIAIFALIIGIIMFCLLAFFIMKALKEKRKANDILTLKNQLLDQQKSEIEAQRDEIANQKEVITNQWQEVDTINKKLISSINYAKRIQTAVLPPASVVDSIFPVNFIYYRPRDIVSGDFYYVTETGKFKVLITADCTGHGIPGAFLSMLGMSALKENGISEYEAANPGIILDRMRVFIMDSLGSNTQKILDDGMDMTICCFDFETMTLNYAAANQPAYIIRNGEIIKLKSNRMPVGRFMTEGSSFTSLSIELQKNDMIYTMSDGIQDQPGGELEDNEFGRKFLARNLANFLAANSDKPMEQQYELLDQTITEWRNGRRQIDDMTLIGVRVI